MLFVTFSVSEEQYEADLLQNNTLVVAADYDLDVVSNNNNDILDNDFNAVLLHLSVGESRIGKSRSAFIMLKNIWASKEIRISTKLRILNSNVKSVLLYGSETWRTTKASMKKIQTFFNACLRRILNIRWPERISNEDLWRRTKQQPMDVQIRQRKWRWIGHTLRKPPSSTTRQALLWNPQGKRKRGRPRNSWRRDTDFELQGNNMTWQEATRAAQHRVRWRTVVDGLCSSRNDRPK